ncbi:hypothetical protein IYX23_05595 [Methylocystis sp. L43]|uniref:hypothetical protein n=1 Tax=unclassified Methylocystis TaxID=2625913 RepID=UPI0018C22845|nr:MULTISPECIES: hypothetical protein [unclassified Methylocystis]MBG0797160.1 hypothetical protein [Methylocystis sp. L43]MBG0804969.1 hypothetical protein [Methylocystis sp. H15]
MDALEYLNTIVEPTIAEFEKEPTCRRRAFLACLVTFHTVDYLAPKKSTELRDRLCKQSQEFLLIDRVAHAFKHVESGHSKSPTKPPLLVSEIGSRPPARLGQMKLGVSRLGDVIGGVATASGRGKDLLPTVRIAAAFLREKAMESPQK